MRESIPPGAAISFAVGLVLLVAAPPVGALVLLAFGIACAQRYARVAAARRHARALAVARHNGAIDRAWRSL